MPNAAADNPPASAALEALVREEYERCHPGETFDDMKQRAAYSRIDSGLYRDWMAIACARAGLDRGALPAEPAP